MNPKTTMPLCALHTHTEGMTCRGQVTSTGIDQSRLCNTTHFQRTAINKLDNERKKAVHIRQGLKAANGSDRRQIVWPECCLKF